MKATFSKISSFKFQISNFYREGFTLLEIMIALAIVGGVVVTILHTVNYHAGIAYEHSANTRMLLLAKEKMAELEMNQLAGKGSIPDTVFIYESSVNPTEEEGIAELKTIISGDDKKIVLSKLVMSKIALNPQ